MTARPDGSATPREEPPALEGEAWRGRLTVRGIDSLYSIAPSPEPDEAYRGPCAWRWLPWADDLAKLRRWRAQGDDASPVFRAAFMAERARADAAEAKLADVRAKIAALPAYVSGGWRDVDAVARALVLEAFGEVPR